MNIKNLVYLAQLEEYNTNRISTWIKNNTISNFHQNKGKLIFTPKALTILSLTKIMSFSINPEKALIYSINLLKPIDYLIKTLLANLIKIKLIVFHKKMITIGITGSWGKTTSKEIIWNFFKTKYKTEKTIDNQNTLMGILLKILKIPINTDIFICEIGAYKIGDINQVCQLIKPKIGVITAVGPMHLERFGSIKNIKIAKTEIINSLPKTGFGFLPIELKKDQKLLLTKCQNIYYFHKISEIYSKIGKIFNINVKEIQKSYQDLASIKHRLETINTGTVNIIDDSYNSNPLGFRLAINKLYQQKTKVKIIVTPGMVELGSLSFVENFKVAKYASQKCTHAIIVGKINQKALTKGFKTSPKIKTFFANSQPEVNKIIQQIIIPKNTTILFENDLPDNYF